MEVFLPPWAAVAKRGEENVQIYAERVQKPTDQVEKSEKAEATTG
jgi:hypothetical protein